MTDKPSIFNTIKYDQHLIEPTEQYCEGTVTLLSHLEGSIGTLSGPFVTGASPEFLAGNLSCSAGTKYTATLVSDDLLMQLDRRVQKLETAMEMWKSAAITLAEMNRELQDAAEADRDDRLTLGEDYADMLFTAEDMMPKTPAIKYSTIDGVQPVAGSSYTFNLATGEVCFVNPPTTTFTLTQGESAEQYDPTAMMGNYYFGGSPLSAGEPVAPQETAEQAYARAMKVVR